MSEKIGCMNCGNISCPNNKKRESKGCGRWKTPEQRILELEEKVGMAERTRDRLISIGFPTFASCKEYAAKLKELEKENAELKESVKNWLKYEKETQYHKSIIKDLKRENAELKEKINILDNCNRLGDVITEEYKDQLNKAKEIIKNLLSAYTTYADSFDDRDNELVADAENFLKDSEVEK